MNKFIKVILLVIISTLLTTQDVTAASSYDDKTMSITCLGKYTGVIHKFIYFAENATSEILYVIRTPWWLTYHKRAKERLRDDGMFVFDSPPSDKCGWLTLAHITYAAVSTGTIYRKGADSAMLNEEASAVLSSLYPSLEIGLLVPLSIIACVLGFIIMLMIMYRCDPKYEQNRIARQERRERENQQTQVQTTDNYEVLEEKAACANV